MPIPEKLRNNIYIALFTNNRHFNKNIKIITLGRIFKFKLQFYYFRRKQLLVATTTEVPETE